MTAVAPASQVDVRRPAQPVGWRHAVLLATGLVTFVCIADIQGLWWYRGEFRAPSQWLVPVLAYAFAAGIALWQWDWLVRVFLSWRFAVVAAAVVAAVALASFQSTHERPAGVPLLTAGARDRLPTHVHALGAAVPVSWQLPSPSRYAEADRASAQGQSDFEYDLPAGWSVQPSNNMRPINLRVAGDQNAECYLATLPGAAGGLLENVNRWREQMGAAPIDEQALAALPRAKLLGREAVVVEVDGTFTPMRGGAPLADARMVGAIAALPAVTLFVKMTGPREVVQKERAAFDRLLASIKMRGASNTKAREAEAARDAGAGDPHGKEPEAGGGGSGGLRWTAPSEWERAGDRVMRLVTYVPKGSDGVECYVTVLGGDAGGVRDNVNRWREQFALPAQTQAEVEALPTVKMLGHDAVIVELSGTFTGMGAGPKEDYGLLGTMAPFQDSTVFVKMTGPKAQVSSERERFLAFCRSLGGG